MTQLFHYLFWSDYFKSSIFCPIIWADFELFWGTYFGVLWVTLSYFGVLWVTLGYFGLDWVGFR